MRWLITSGLTIAAAALLGCTGGGSGNSATAENEVTTEGDMALLITDAASDLLSTLSLTLTEVTLSSTELGETPNLLAEPVPLELLSLAGHQALIGFVPVASGQYDEVRVAIDPGSVSARDLDGNAVVLNVTRASGSTSLEGLALRITGDGSARLRIDIDANESLVERDGQLEFALSIHADDADGKVQVEGVFGRVLEVRPAQRAFTMEIRTSESSDAGAGILDVLVDDATVLLTSGGDTSASIAAFFAATRVGRMLHVHGQLQDDGSLLAASVEIAQTEESASITGFVLALNLDSNLLEVRVTDTQDGHGGVRDQLAHAATVTVAWDQGTVFVRHERDSQAGSLPGDHVSVAHDGHAGDPPLGQGETDPHADQEDGEQSGDHGGAQGDGGELESGDVHAGGDGHDAEPGDDHQETDFDQAHQEGKAHHNEGQHGPATEHDLRIGQRLVINVLPVVEPPAVQPRLAVAQPNGPLLHARRIEINEELPTYEGRIVSTAGLPDRIAIRLAPRDPAVVGGLLGPDDSVQVTLTQVEHMILRADGDPQLNTEALRPGLTIWLRGALRDNSEIPTIDATLVRVKPGEVRGELTNLDPFTHLAVIDIAELDGFFGEPPLSTPLLLRFGSQTEFTGDATSERDLARSFAELHGARRFRVRAVGLGDGYGGVRIYGVHVAVLVLEPR